MLKDVMEWGNAHFWIVQIFLTVLFTLTLHAFETIIFKRVLKRVAKTKNYMDETLLTALHPPLSVFIWVMGICFAATIAASLENSPYIFTFVPTIQKLSILALVTWFAIRFIQQFEKNYIAHALRERKTIDKTIVHAMSQLLTISVLITAILVGMQLFGMPISGLLAFGGIGGAGVAFASKDLLANFFGSLVIYLDRPFKVGDWIRSPDRQIEGTVEYIGWRVTHIRTFDKRPLYVPNGTFLTISVENPSRMSNRRIHTKLGIRYQDASRVADITNDIKTMLSTHPEIDTSQTLIVNLVELGPSSLNIMIYVFTKTTDWIHFQAIQQDIFLKMMSIVEQHGAECAFPTSTVHFPEPLQINQH